jgi:magnesium transporter
VDVIMQEATEDVQKMAALAPLKHSYFETSFWRILWGRSYILIVLLLAESFSGIILDAYESSISKFLMFFLPMLISAGGNTSSQTSAIVIQGMATGDIHEGNVRRFLKRELIMAGMLACALGITAFVRVYMMGGANVLEASAISLALAILVMTAVVLGSCIPLILQRFNIDPAFSAGPFLATILDIFGVLIYCYVLKILIF